MLKKILKKNIQILNLKSYFSLRQVSVCMVELNESDLMVTEMIMGVGIEFENFTN